MTLNSQLTKCKSLDSLQTFCQHTLDNKEVQFNGHSYVNLKTGDTLDLYKITNRLIDLMEEKPSLEEQVPIAQQASFVIFTLQKITELHSKTKSSVQEAFGEGSKLNELASQCKQTVRKSQSIMNTLVANYNQLANQVNERIIQAKTTESEPRFHDDLIRLEFLNQFLGLKWERLHRKGSAQLPLCDTETFVEAPVPASMHPKDCKSLGALYHLVLTLRETHTVIHDGKTIEIPGKTTLSIDNFYTQLNQLYEEAMKLDPYVKSDVYFQTTATIFILNKLNPSFKRSMPPETVRINSHCIDEMKNNPKSLAKLQSLYNSCAKTINDPLENGMMYFDSITLQQPHISWWDRNAYKINLENVEFLNQFMEFPLSLEQLQGVALLPVIYDLNDPQDKLSARFNYNYYGLIINAQIKSQRVASQCAALERKLHPENLTALMLTEEEKKKLAEELGRLKSEMEIIGPPFPKRFFELLVKEQVRLANLFNIDLSAEQKKGLAPFPIFGREIKPKQISSEIDVLSPKRARGYNLLKDQINVQRRYREAKLAYLEAHREFTSRPWESLLKTFHQDYGITDQDKIEELRRQWVEIKNDPNYFGENNHYLWRLASLLLISEPYGIVKLNEKQMNLEEDLPTVDINAIPFPGKEILAKGLLQIADEKQKIEAIYTWPSHWKKEMGIETEKEGLFTWGDVKLA